MKRGQLLREVLFYASFRYNSETEQHGISTLTDRNDQVLHAIQSIADSGIHVFSW